MSLKPKVVVVIVTWNNKDIVDIPLKSLASQNYNNFVTLIVDNGSSDNTLDYVKKKYPPVQTIDAGKNLGFAAGNNLGIKEAVGKYGADYVVLLNSDAWLSADWLSIVVKFAQTKPHLACAQGLTLKLGNPSRIDSTHIYLSQNGQATQAHHDQPNILPRYTKRVFGVNAAAALYSAKFIKSQPFEDFFDKDFFMYLEDVDVIMRATIMGWQNYFVGDAIAKHVGSASSAGSNFSLKMTFRNNFPMIVKNMPLRLIIKLVPKLIRSDLETIRHLARQKRWSAALRIPEGRVLGILLLPKMIFKRFELRKYRHSVDSKYIWQLMRWGYIK
jgi:GT2 family glycosyltransferase